MPTFCGLVTIKSVYLGLFELIGRDVMLKLLKFLSRWLRLIYRCVYFARNSLPTLRSR